MPELTYESRLLLSKEELLRKMEKYAGVYPDEITAESLREAGLASTVALLPREHKDRTRYLGNLLAQMCFALKIEDEGDDGKLKAEFVRLATALSYLLNSTSFQTGRYEDFDRAEMDRKLCRKQE